VGREAGNSQTQSSSSEVTPKPRAARHGAGVTYRKKIEEFFNRAGLKPRPLQLEAAEQLAEQFLSSPTVGFQAPTGFFPVVWRVRTFEIAKRIAEDCALLNFPFYIAAGRERLCKLYKQYGDNVHLFCRYLRYKCPYYRAISVPYATSYEDLKASIKDVCPYFSQTFVNADVYIAPYGLSLKFNSNLTVIDEAHNYLMQIDSFPLSRIKELAKEVGVNLNIYDTFDPQKIYDLLEPHIIEKLERGEKIMNGDVFTRLRGSLGWIDGPNAYILRLTRPRRAIFVSATLEPLSRLFNFSLIKVPVVKHKAFVLTWLSTQFESYDVSMANKYNSVIFLLRKYFERILVFSTMRVATLLHYDYDEQYLDRVNNVNDWRGVLILHSRGRRAEGVNLSADVVLVAGAPFPPPEVRVERVGLSKEDLVSIVVIQNVGRVLRSPESNPVIILADWRFSKIQQLNDYYELREVHDLPELDRVLKEWKQRQNQQHNTQQPQ
jgi:DNA excision repair protein ERCC-2